MNNIFSFPRFFKYSLSKIRLDSRKYLSAIAVNVASAILLYVLSQYGVITSMEVNGYLSVVITFTVLALLGVSFKEFHRTGHACRAFTLPASRLEKYLHIALINVVILPLLFMQCLDTQMTVNVSIEYEREDINTELAERTGMTVEELTKNIAENEQYGFLNDKAIIISSNLLFFAYFFLCSVLFRRRQLLCGFLILIVLSIIFLNVILRYVDFEKISSVLELSFRQYALILFSMTALLLLFGWFRFRKLQLHK